MAVQTPDLFVIFIIVLLVLMAADLLNRHKGE